MKLKNILYPAVAAALLPAMTLSCDTEVRGTLYEGDDTAGYAFAADQFDIDLLVSDGNRILIPVYRDNSSGAGAVEVVLDAVSGNAEGVFSLESGTAVFEDGEYETEIAVAYEDINLLDLGQVYRFSLSFDEAEASPSGVSSVTVSARRELVYREIGTGIYTCTFFTQMGAPAVLEVPVEKADGANAYRILDLFADGYDAEFTFDDQGNIIEFEPFETGITSDEYGMLSFEYIDRTFSKEGNLLHFTFQVVSELYAHDKSYDTLLLPDPETGVVPGS